MAFIIQGLDPALFGSVSDQMQAKGKSPAPTYYDVDEHPGFPCRITLDDIPLGQRVALVSYQHHASDSPYNQAGPIFVSVGACSPGHYVDQIPPALKRRNLSLRAYDQDGMMIDARLVDGQAAQSAILALFENPAVCRIDAHNAVRGCFAAHIHPHETD